MWVNGSLPEDNDPIWSTSSGSLQFSVYTNNTILDFSSGYYVQFVLNISGTHPNPPYLTRLGVEGALIVDSVPSNGFKDIYVASVSGTVGDKTANLICWHRE